MNSLDFFEAIEDWIIIIPKLVIVFPIALIWHGLNKLRGGEDNGR